jgi:hypothetical protein
MSEDKKFEDNQGKSTDDPKAKMLAALAKKHKVAGIKNITGVRKSSILGAGQNMSSIPKMHRRKTGP